MAETGGDAQPALVVLRDVAKAYAEGDRRRVVFSHLNATLWGGRVIAITGRSGSGKSTLLNLIGGIDAPDAGDVIVGGASLGQMSERERTLYRRHKVGFVFQFFNLIPTLTVEENLRLPLELIGSDKSAIENRIGALLAEVGLEDRMHSFSDRLSGGEQQRVAIARALVHDPELILADEPTGNLDLETGHEVLRVLQRLVRDAGKTLVMATHSRAAAALADTVLHVEEGSLVPGPDS